MMINHTHADDNNAYASTLLKGADDHILSPIGLLTKLFPRLWPNDHAHYTVRAREHCFVVFQLASAHTLAAYRWYGFHVYI